MNNREMESKKSEKIDWRWSSLIERWAGSSDPVTRACQADPRFSYGVYVPKGFRLSEANAYNLAVLVHGSSRVAEKLKNEFIDFADRTNTVLLAPMFPCGIIEPEDIHNYKFIKFHDIRYDEILLSMVSEVGEALGIKHDKFLLHGFSGGGQFAHRFFYLHPDRLLGVSIGAPGRITYLDESESWYNGISDFKEQFGYDIDYEELKKVKILLIVGAADLDVLDYKDDPTYAEGEGRRGKTRVERVNALYENYKEHNLNVSLVEVLGVGHENSKVVEYVKAFFIKTLGLERGMR